MNKCIINGIWELTLVISYFSSSSLSIQHYISNDITEPNIESVFTLDDLRKNAKSSGLVEMGSKRLPNGDIIINHWDNNSMELKTSILSENPNTGNITIQKTWKPNF